jgi:uncharacterized membrane protein
MNFADFSCKMIYEFDQGTCQIITGLAKCKYSFQMALVTLTQSVQNDFRAGVTSYLGIFNVHVHVIILLM